MSETENQVDDDGFAIGARPLCPFCSKPFGNEMINAWVKSSGCESGGWDADALVEIVCDGCERLIYSK